MTSHRAPSGLVPDPSDPVAVADRLHSAAIHLLRRVRVEDAASGLSASRLSALSVIVFAGPITIGDLAAAEQVAPPTTSRMVTEMVQAGLVRREEDPSDRRLKRIVATDEGVAILQEGRRRRVAHLARRVETLSDEERSILATAALLLERLSLPDEHPRRG